MGKERYNKIRKKTNMIVLVFIRSLIFNVLFYTLALLGLCITGIIGWVVPYQVLDWFWNRGLLVFFRWMAYVICGIKIEVRGKENILKGGAIYAAKHQSAFETYFLTSLVKQGSTYIFKKELTYIPFFGWAVAAYGSIPIDRGGGSSVMRKMLEVAKKFLKAGRPIIIFPEGTRTKPGETRDYKPGVAFMYQNLDVPLVPVALNTGLFWAKKSFMRYPGKVIVEFLPPIERGLDKREFMDTLKNKIEVKCAEINKESLGR